MKTRMEHILEIVKELVGNEQMTTMTHNLPGRAKTIVEFAYHIYNHIEEKEEMLTIEARLGI